MPLRTNSTGKRWVEMHYALPGTPEQIWRAMATGPGNAGWFTSATIEGRVGGKLSFDFGGGMATRGEVLAWEPHQRIAYVEHEWMPGAPACETEITITPRHDSGCNVRMTHTIEAASAEWDSHLESFEHGWAGFFPVLKVYLGEFTDAEAATFMSMAVAADPTPVAWKKLCALLGFTGADVGDTCKSTSTPEALSGRVVRVHQDEQMRVFMVRLDGSEDGILVTGTFEMGGSTHISISRFLYGSGSAARKVELADKWAAWFTEHFPAPAAE